MRGPKSGAFAPYSTTSLNSWAGNPVFFGIRPTELQKWASTAVRRWGPVRPPDRGLDRGRPICVSFSGWRLPPPWVEWAQNGGLTLRSVRYEALCSGFGGGLLANRQHG